MSNLIFCGYKAVVKVYQYQDGSPAIQLFTEDGSPLATATICLVDYGLTPPPGHCYIKNYAENHGILDALLKAFVLEDTGKTVEFGPFDTVAHLVKLIH